MSSRADLNKTFSFDTASQALTSIEEEKSVPKSNISNFQLSKSNAFIPRNAERPVIDPDLLQSSRNSSIQVHITHASFDNEFEKDSVHSNGSLKISHLSNENHICDPSNRRHSLPAYALDKVKHFLTTKSPSSNAQLFTAESVISRRKKSIIGLFNTIGTNLGLVSPKKSIGNGVMISALHGSSGSVDLARMRHSLGILEMDSVSKNALPTVPIISIDDIYYRPHRSFARDILCCICFKKHDEYDNLIESHSCARIFTALVLLTIVCMLIGYIIKAAGEKK